MRALHLIGWMIWTCSQIGLGQTSGTDRSNSDIDQKKAAAERGDSSDQLAYALAIKDQSRSEAAMWLKKAADQGNGEAWFWLGYGGLGEQPPVFYYEKAAEKGYKKAFSYLLDNLLFRAGSAADVAKAKKFGDLARKLHVKLGYDSAAMLKTIDHCFEAGAAVIPAHDLPTEEEKKKLQLSNRPCWEFQTGVGSPRNWSEYRKCLLARNTDEIDNNELAEIYANGWGVPRNPKLAIALVCHGSSVPAELIGMVETLISAVEQKNLEEEFTFCGHVTSGMNGGGCAAKKEEISKARRAAEIAGITSNWSAKQLDGFQAMRDAADSYFETHAREEQDMSGTARSQIATNEEAKLREELLAAVKTFEAGKFPEGGHFKATDKQLNDLYKKVMNKSDGEGPGAVTKAGIRASQRKWLKYRDAWVAFAAVRYPKLSADTLQNWLTNLRIDQLKDAGGYLQP